MIYSEMLWVRLGAVPEDGLVQRPSHVAFGGDRRRFDDLSLEQLDSIGWNAAEQLVREPYTTYETEWVKGEDLVYREEIVSAVVDEASWLAAKAAETRDRRDLWLTMCDWTQLADCPLGETERAAWAAYRQALRDVPQQTGFPEAVAWPEAPSGAE